MYSITVLSVSIVALSCCFERSNSKVPKAFSEDDDYEPLLSKGDKVTCVRTMVEEKIESRTGLEKTLVEFRRVNKK